MVFKTIDYFRICSTPQNFARRMTLMCSLIKQQRVPITTTGAEWPYGKLLVSGNCRQTVPCPLYFISKYSWHTFSGAELPQEGLWERVVSCGREGRPP